MDSRCLPVGPHTGPTISPGIPIYQALLTHPVLPPSPPPQVSDLRRQLEQAQAAAAEAAGNDVKLKRQAQTVAELAAFKSKLVTTESRLAKLQDRHAALQVRWAGGGGLARRALPTAGPGRGAGRAAAPSCCIMLVQPRSLLGTRDTDCLHVSSRHQLQHSMTGLCTRRPLFPPAAEAVPGSSADGGRVGGGRRAAPGAQGLCTDCFQGRAGMYVCTACAISWQERLPSALQMAAIAVRCGAASV